MTGTATIGWLTTRVGELDNLMTAMASTDKFTIINNAGQAVLTIANAFPATRLFRIEMELGAAMGQMLQAQYDINQPGFTLNQTTFYSIVATGATIGLFVCFPPSGVATGSGFLLGSTLRGLVISGTVNAFMTGPNFLALATWYEKNINWVFDPAFPRSPDAYPLALTDRANWMLYSEMHSARIKTGKLKVDGKTGTVTIYSEKSIMMAEIPEDEQTPFLGTKGGGLSGGGGETLSGSGRGGGSSVNIYWTE